jgi:hypothetical protein
MLKLFLLNAISSFITAIILLTVVVPASALAQQTEVSVHAPERVSGTFDVTIAIANVVDMDSGQFDLSFDPSVVKVIDVKAGSIAGTKVPIDQWAPLDEDTIRVLFNFSGVQGVTGSGSLATICTRITGKVADMSVLELSSGLLVDKEATKIPAIWLGDEVTVEASALEPEPVPDRQTDQAPGPEGLNGGISISTPFAVGVLAALVAIPILFLLVYRRK